MFEFLNDLVGKKVVFHGYDGKDYEAEVLKVEAGCVKIRYMGIIAYICEPERIELAKAETYMDGEFIGVYRVKGRPHSRIPVRLWNGKHYDLMGNVIDLGGYELFDPPAAAARLGVA